LGEFHPFTFFLNREGETVILKCLIQAHPWVYRIMWYRDGEEVVASDRIFIDEQQVALKPREPRDPRNIGHLEP
jgi:hypothetical protein